MGEGTERARASELLDLLVSAPVKLAESGALLSAALGLAADLDHSVYDCVYLALALDRGIPLVTADEKLARAVRKATRTAKNVVLLSELPA